MRIEHHLKNELKLSNIYYGERVKLTHIDTFMYYYVHYIMFSKTTIVFLTTEYYVVCFILALDSQVWACACIVLCLYNPVLSVSVGANRWLQLSTKIHQSCPRSTSFHLMCALSLLPQLRCLLTWKRQTESSSDGVHHSRLTSNGEKLDVKIFFFWSSLSFVCQWVSQHPCQSWRSPLNLF